jgi:hypothetical protein
MFGILDRKIKVMVIVMTGGPHVSVVMDVQPQTHQFLDQTPISESVRSVLCTRFGLWEKRNLSFTFVIKFTWKKAMH